MFSSYSTIRFDMQNFLKMLIFQPMSPPHTFKGSGIVVMAYCLVSCLSTFHSFQFDIQQDIFLKKLIAASNLCCVCVCVLVCVCVCVWGGGGSHSGVFHQMLRFIECTSSRKQ